MFVINSPKNYNPLKSVYLLECDAMRSCGSLLTFWRNFGTRLHGITSQKIILFIVTEVRTWNPRIANHINRCMTASVV
jgi:hypothetical protein